jgi:hypothetical protein
VDQTTKLVLEQIENLKSGTDRPILLVWARDGEPSWRKLNFYLPSEKVYVLEEGGNPVVDFPRARLLVGNDLQKEYVGKIPLRLPVPREGRLIWITGGPNVARVGKAVALQQAPPVHYTDLAPVAGSFRWGSFEFIPE